MTDKKGCNGENTPQVDSIDLCNNKLVSQVEAHEKAHRFTFKRAVPYVVYCLVIPIVIFIGVALYEGRKYNLISIAIAILTCIPFFVHFEKKETGVRELVVIAVMSAISVISRIIFFGVPHFKPVAAVVIITAIAFGGEAGFMTGSISAIVSNIYFGQGPWTPFQMFAWGFLGFLTGLITDKKKTVGPVFLILVGFIGGVGFSAFMDIYTTVSMGGEFKWERYLMYIISALPVTATYVVSNITFLLVLTKPILGKLNRIKTKYGLFKGRNTVNMTWSLKKQKQ